ncbi:MAG: replication factor C large subunit [Euryarchaeota archaeon]|nr:replication factor C large subunit [Euryarchaeota archaeon]
MDWVEKYRPHQLQDLVGNGPAIRQIAGWARTWTRDSPPLLLYGKPGTGKTSAAHALASDMKWEAIELNASDHRTKDVIEKIAGTSSTTASLTGASRKLIIIDEADNLHGTADRGGAKAIIEIIKHTRQPIVIIANDMYGIAKELKSQCDAVLFKALQARSIAPRLKYICAAEGVVCDESATHMIAESAAGDLRAAINMLYAAAIGREEINSSDISTNRKDNRATIFELIGSVFRGKSDELLMSLSYEISDTPDTIEQWLEINIGQMPGIKEQAKAHQHIAEADEYVGYTYKRQYYTLWRYATALMIIGTADAAGGRGLLTRVMPPARWRKMAGARRKKAIRNSTMKKLSEYSHIPRGTLRDDFLTPISLMVENHPETFVRDLNLDKDELDFFLHDKTRSAKIIKEISKKKKEAEKKSIKKKETRKSNIQKSGSENNDNNNKKRDLTGDIAPKTGYTENKEEVTEPPDNEKPVLQPRGDHKQSTLFDGF